MIDIEKVKQGLRCCIVRHPDDKMRCAECPYRDPTTYCLNRLKHDALSALDEMTVKYCEACKIEPEKDGEDNA